MRWIAPLLITCGLVLAPGAGLAASSVRLAGLDNPEHIRCARKASATYRVPLAAVLVVLDVERGWVGAEQPNTREDGSVHSHDLGPMQINDAAWGRRLAEAGISREQVRDDACINIHVGTWILAGHIADLAHERATTPGEIPLLAEAILRYHSRTRRFQDRYADLVRAAIERGLQSITSDREGATSQGMTQ